MENDLTPEEAIAQFNKELEEKVQETIQHLDEKRRKELATQVARIKMNLEKAHAQALGESHVRENIGRVLHLHKTLIDNFLKGWRQKE
jgi:hypothetical protein